MGKCKLHVVPEMFICLGNTNSNETESNIIACKSVQYNFNYMIYNFLFLVSNQGKIVEAGSLMIIIS